MGIRPSLAGGPSRGRLQSRRVPSGAGSGHLKSRRESELSRGDARARPARPLTLARAGLPGKSPPGRTPPAAGGRQAAVTLIPSASLVPLLLQAPRPSCTDRRRADCPGVSRAARGKQSFPEERWGVAGAAAETARRSPSCWRTRLGAFGGACILGFPASLYSAATLVLAYCRFYLLGTERLSFLGDLGVETQQTVESLSGGGRD